MNTRMHGKPVAAIYFAGGVGNEYGNPEVIRSDSKRTMHLSATHHGDHDQFWIVECDGDKEVRRHRASHVDSITWAEPSGDAK
jgi:hypothetical protein